MQRKKIIKVPLDAIGQMAAAHGCSKVTVWNALAYRSYSEQARTIREQAINIYGGVETTKLVF